MSATSGPAQPGESLFLVCSPLRGTIVSVAVAVGDSIEPGGLLAIVESMKLHHEIRSEAAGHIAVVHVGEGATVAEGAVLIEIVLDSGRVDGTAGPADTSAGRIAAQVAEEVEDRSIRRDLAEVIERHELVTDSQRPDAVAKRRSQHRRTARENLDDLIDPHSFVEYGPLVIAAQRRRRSLDDLITATPADGLVGGIARVNGDYFAGREARCVVMSYDYTVLAGTQGTQNHRKKDRLFELAEQFSLPVVLFAEGGGGRPGDTDALGVSGLDCLAFRWFAQLSGSVPLIGIASGYCFAGNAALLGCCDVVIATVDANIGMGGPAMIEGGGLGVFEPSEIGPAQLQCSTGVVDVLVEDEAEAIAVAKSYLSYFQGSVDVWEAPEPEAARTVVPEDRLRAYQVRAALDAVFDRGSILELRAGFGIGMITALARLEGRPVGVIANNPAHLAGAIDSDGADKAARFLQLCDGFGLPVVSLVDTPGMMVGPDVEATGLVRHCSRLFVTGANLSVPLISVVLRKAYGLGAQAMMGGSTKAPVACLAWPTAEFGGMGLEGAVRLGYRKELQAIDDPVERDALFQELVERLYEHGRALSIATHFEIDDVIDPADTRRWLNALLEAAPPMLSGRRPMIDTW